MNLLQRISFPQENVCMIEEMFFKTKKSTLRKNNSQFYYQLDANSSISTNTYFNTFSASKWNKFTNVDNFIIKIALKGDFEIRLVHCYLMKEEVIEDIVQSVRVNTNDIRDIMIKYDFSLDTFEELFFIELISNTDGGEFYGGGFYTETKKTFEPHIGIIMCTYKREKFIENNIRLFSEMKESIDVFIVDNASSLNEQIFNGNIHLIKNKNTGGAGGFTRGLIEVLTKYKHCTHVLLMDDDILINTSAIEKTIAFLSFLNKDSLDLFIGGATLSLAQKNKQLESAAVWNDNILYNLKNNLNLIKEKDLLINNLEESRSYNAWVYCCIPINKISLDNLPLPLFVRGDDMEYGIRLSKKILTMNGIGVWHVPVDNKYSSFMNYYVIRNILILNALYDNKFSKKGAIKMLFGRVLRECFYYRYNDARLILKAYQDFLKGVDFFYYTDGETLHKNIMENSKKLFNYKELETIGKPYIYNKLVDIKNILPESRLHKIIRLMTLNGYLLPSVFMKKGASSYNTIELTEARPIFFYRYKTVLQVDLPGQKGFVGTLDRMSFCKILLDTINISIKIIFNYKQTLKDYKNNISKIKDIDFWSKYLDLK